MEIERVEAIVVQGSQNDADFSPRTLQFSAAAERGILIPDHTWDRLLRSAQRGQLNTSTVVREMLLRHLPDDARRAG